MKIMESRFFYILLFLCFCCPAFIFSQVKIITPESYELMSKRSIDIIATYEYYNSLWKKYDANLYIGMDAMRSAQRDYVISSTLDSVAVEVVPLQFKAAIYGKSTIKKVHTMELFLIWNAMNLISDIPSNLDLVQEENTYYGNLSWNIGNVLFGIRYSRGAYCRYTIGFLAKLYPYIVTGSDSTKQFSVYYDEKRKSYTGTKDKANLFFDGKIWYIDFQTLYDTQEEKITYLMY